ncbi:hypothetical protein AVEN_11766-1 [Araneus ventricosus]|uniref:Uncharacterized protein n=1 Tax=Araneus ventricosus TaxID=182803 RepID=A0A4Y2ACJ0_ARAVE|nr:hypothetical protein AVEN_11766-1 [Araneus ventricosus]
MTRNILPKYFVSTQCPLLMKTIPSHSHLHFQNLRPLPYNVGRNFLDLKKSLLKHLQVHCLHRQSRDLHQFQLQQEVYVKRSISFSYGVGIQFNSLILQFGEESNELTTSATFNNKSVEETERRAGSFNNPSR